MKPILFLVVVLAACGSGGGSDGGTDSGIPPLGPTLSSIQANIFPTCASGACHGPPTLAGDMDLSPGKSYETLVGTNGQGAPIPDHSDPGELTAIDAGYVLVAPSDPAKSFLLLKVSPGLNPEYGNAMPDAADGLAALTSAQVNAISGWISAGAQNN